MLTGLLLLMLVVVGWCPGCPGCFCLLIDFVGRTGLAGLAGLEGWRAEDWKAAGTGWWWWSGVEWRAISHSRTAPPPASREQEETRLETRRETTSRQGEPGLVAVEGSPVQALQCLLICWETMCVTHTHRVSSSSSSSSFSPSHSVQISASPRTV